MSKYSRNNIFETPTETEPQAKYGIHGYDLKREIKRNGRPTEFRATILKKIPVRNPLEDKWQIKDIEVLISNKDTIANEPKIIDGVHKYRIDDDLMLYLTEETIGKLRIDINNVTLYIFNNPDEQPTQLPDNLRIAIAKRISRLMQSLPPPAPNCRFGGRRF